MTAPQPIGMMTSERLREVLHYDPDTFARTK